jgi:hypothetical protein
VAANIKYVRRTREGLLATSNIAEVFPDWKGPAECWMFVSPHDDDVWVQLVQMQNATRDAASLRWGRRERQGLVLWVPYFDVGGHQVWGATAMMLGEFSALLDPAFGPGPRPDLLDDEPITLF